MELKQLRSFTAVVDYGSFTRAADRIYTSQPTISAHIKALEEELGVQLIARDTKNLEITQKGMELYRCAKGMEDMRSRLIEKWAEEGVRTVYLGASTIPSSCILPKLLEGFRRIYPDIGFAITQADSAAVADAVESGRCDIGIIGEKPSGAFSSFRVAQDRTIIISPNGDEYLKIKESGDIKELLKKPVIFREQGSASRKSAEMLLEELGADVRSLDIIASINDQEAIKNLVEHGMGIAFISALAAEERVREGRLLCFDTGLEAAGREFYLISKKNNALSSAAAAFAKYVKRERA